MYKNNECSFMDELEKFNQDHEKSRRKYKLLLDEFENGKYLYSGKTFSEIPLKSKKRKVKVYMKGNDKEGKLF